METIDQHGCRLVAGIRLKGEQRGWKPNGSFVRLALRQSVRQWPGSIVVEQRAIDTVESMVPSR